MTIDLQLFFFLKNYPNRLLTVWEKKNYLYYGDYTSFSSISGCACYKFSIVQAIYVKFSATVRHTVLYLSEISSALLAVTNLSIQVWMQYLT